MLSFQLSTMETVRDKVSHSPRRQAPQSRGDLSASAGDAVRSSASPERTGNGLLNQCMAQIPPTETSMNVGNSLRCIVETASATKSGAMGLESESSTTTRRCGDIRCRTMPGSATNRSDYSLLVRALGIPIRRVLIVFRVVPIRDPLPDVPGHILHTVG